MNGRLLLTFAGAVFAMNAWAADEVDCNPDAARRAFTVCLACHTASADAAHLSGPNLWGIMGRRAGTVPGYTYSDAIAESGVVWGADTLDQYLADPDDYLPGTRMMITPIRDQRQRSAIACYLASLTPAS